MKPADKVLSQASIPCAISTPHAQQASFAASAFTFQNSPTNHPPANLVSWPGPPSVGTALTSLATSSQPPLFNIEHLLAAGFRGAEYQLLVLMSFLIKLYPKKTITYTAVMEQAGMGNLDDIGLTMSEGVNKANIEAYQVKYFNHPISIYSFFNQESDNATNKSEKMHIGKFLDGWLNWRKKPHQNLHVIIFTNADLDETLKKCVTTDEKLDQEFISQKKKILFPRSPLKKIGMVYKNFLTKLPNKKISDKASEKVWKELNELGFINDERHLTDAFYGNITQLNLEQLTTLPETVTAQEVQSALIAVSNIDLNNQTDLYETLYKEALDYLDSKSKDNSDALKKITEEEKNKLFQEFLKSVRFKIKQKDINELEKEIQQNLKQILDGPSELVFLCLYYALREWFRQEPRDQKIPTLTNQVLKQLMTDSVTQSRDVAMLQGRTQSLMSRISYTSENQFVERVELDTLNNYLNDSTPKIVLVIGESGIGKSGLVKRLLEKRHYTEYLMLTAKEISDDVIFEKLLKVLNKINSIKTLIIDSAEFLFSLPDIQLNQLFIKLKKLKQTVIITLPPEAQNHRIFEEIVNIIKMAPLSLDNILIKFPKLLPYQNVPSLLKIIQKPFYLNIALRQLVKINMNQTQECWEDYLIRLQINNKLEGEHITRTQELLNIGSYYLLTKNSMSFALPSYLKDLSNQLVNNGILTIFDNYFLFSHDLHFKWAVEQLITQKFNLLVALEGKLDEFLKFPSLIHLAGWFRKNFTKVIDYLNLQTSLNLSNDTINILLKLIAHTIINASSDFRINCFKHILSKICNDYLNKKITTNNENFKMALSMLLEISEPLDEYLIKYVCNIKKNKYEKETCWYIKPDLIHRTELDKILIFTLLMKINSAFPRYHSKETISLIYKVCFLPANQDISIRHSPAKRFGLIEDDLLSTLNFKSASAYRGPFYTLLHYHGIQSLSSIVKLINNACINYCNSKFSDYTKTEMLKNNYDIDQKPIKIQLTDQKGKKILVQGNYFLWGLYRNAINCVSPGLVQCALMAIEKWLMELIKNSQDDLLNTAIDVIINESETVATIAILVGISFLQIDKLNKNILSLLKIKEFYDWDRTRVIIEPTIRHYFLNPIYAYELGMDPEENLQDERHDSDILPHRKYCLIDLVYTLQQTQLKSSIEQILDEHFLTVSSARVITAEMEKWKNILSNMDARKAKLNPEKTTESFDETNESLSFDSLARKIYKKEVLQYNSETLIDKCKQLCKEVKDPFLKGFVISGCCHIACALLSNNTNLNSEQSTWCFDVLFQNIRVNCDSKEHNFKISVGVFFAEQPIAETLPNLLNRFSTDNSIALKIKESIAIALTHASTSIRTSTAYAIKSSLWNTNPNFVRQCILAIIHLITIENQDNVSNIQNEQFDCTLAINTLRNQLTQEKLTDTITNNLTNAKTNHSLLIFSGMETINLALVIGSGNFQDSLSKKLFFCYLKNLIDYKKQPPFRNLHGNIFPNKLLGDFILSLENELPDMLDIILSAKNNNCRLLEDVLFGISNFLSHGIDCQKFWFIWNYILDASLIMKISVENALLCHFPKDISMISTEDLYIFLLKSAHIITNDSIFCHWLRLVGNIPFEKLNNVLNIVFTKSNHHLVTQKNIEHFIYIILTKYCSEIIKEKSIYKKILDILGLLKQNETTSFLREKIRANVTRQILSPEDLGDASLSIKKSEVENAHESDQFTSNEKEIGDKPSESALSANTGSPRDPLLFMKMTDYVGSKPNTDSLTQPMPSSMQEVAKLKNDTEKSTLIKTQLNSLLQALEHILNHGNNTYDLKKDKDSWLIFDKKENALGQLKLRNNNGILQIFFYHLDSPGDHYSLLTEMPKYVELLTAKAKMQPNI